MLWLGDAVNEYKNSVDSVEDDTGEFSLNEKVFEYV